LKLISQGKTGLIEFIHPDYVSAVYINQAELNLFDNIWTKADTLFILLLVTISLVAIVVAYYFIVNRYKS
jgi:hypothetical protein